jgi:hypothetical protein
LAVDNLGSIAHEGLVSTSAMLPLRVPRPTSCQQICRRMGLDLLYL